MKNRLDRNLFCKKTNSFQQLGTPPQGVRKGVSFSCRVIFCLPRHQRIWNKFASFQVTDHVWIVGRDGATPHRWRDIVDWLMQQFPERTISMGLHVPWPARSPDLSSLDFFLWGYVKQLVYCRRSFNNLAELRETIEDVFEDIRNTIYFKNMLQATSHAVLSRMRHYIEIEDNR